MIQKDESGLGQTRLSSLAPKEIKVTNKTQNNSRVSIQMMSGIKSPTPI